MAITSRKSAVFLFYVVVLSSVLNASIATKHALDTADAPCEATNPIDACWRCKSDWESNRFRLADCALGFGYNATGGKGGKIYVVTDSSDGDLLNPKPGTLRHAVIQKEPLWIIFSQPMVIRLTQELLVNSYKTIDARGSQVHIAHGAGITLHSVNNIIIHGLHIHDIKSGAGGSIRDSVDHYGIRTRSDGDGIALFTATNVWIDHVSMSNCEDGLIDIIMGSTGVTISNSHFAKHNEVMLFGASESHVVDKKMKITVAYNHFGKGLIQRMPRCRFGFIHVVNNDYTHWLKYAIGGSSNPTVISQGNRFIAQDDKALKEVTHRDYASESEWSRWTWRSEDDVMLNGAFFKQGGQALKSTGFSKKEFIPAMPGSSVGRITHYAGPIKCLPKRPC